MEENTNGNGMGREYVKNIATELLEKPFVIYGVKTETVECKIATESFQLTVEKRIEPCRWEKHPYGVICGNCKTQALQYPSGEQALSAYCPHCGKKMEEGD